MIEPLQSDEELVADIETACLSNPDALHVWWLGQSGFLCAHRGMRIVLDPYLSNSLTEKYAGTDKPHVRMTRQVVAPACLSSVAWVTSSHRHTDHLDRETLLGLRSTNPGLRLVLPHTNIAFAADRLSLFPDDPFFYGISVGERLEADGVSFEAIPAAHDAVGRECIGLVVRIGTWTLLHPGDTIPWPGMDEQVAGAGVDIALLPINGRRPERRVAGNLWGDEAARWAKAMGARIVVPCHYEMFEFNTETPQLFESTCTDLGQAFRTLRAGERLSLSR